MYPYLSKTFFLSVFGRYKIIKKDKKATKIQIQEIQKIHLPIFIKNILFECIWRVQTIHGGPASRSNGKEGLGYDLHLRMPGDTLF